MRINGLKSVAIPLFLYFCAFLLDFLILLGRYFMLIDIVLLLFSSFSPFAYCYERRSNGDKSVISLKSDFFYYLPVLLTSSWITYAIKDNDLLFITSLILLLLGEIFIIYKFYRFRLLPALLSILLSLPYLLLEPLYSELLLDSVTFLYVFYLIFNVKSHINELSRLSVKMDILGEVFWFVILFEKGERLLLLPTLLYILFNFYLLFKIGRFVTNKLIEKKIILQEYFYKIFRSQSFYNRFFIYIPPD